MMSKITEKQFEKFCKRLQLPEGFTGELGPAPSWPKEKAFVVKNEGPTIKITFNQWGDGTTEFMVPDHGWRSFDRRGVEQSFYFTDFDTQKISEKADPNEILAVQLERIAERLRYFKAAVKVPGMPGGGWTLSPETLAKYKNDLRNGRSINFMPSGFGTGYRIGAKLLLRSRYAKPCSAELATFFEVPQLWYETVDCD